MGDKRFVFCGLAMAQRGYACAIELGIAEDKMAMA